MVFSRPRVRLRQQFLPERFAAQTPAAPDAFKFPAVFLRPALLQMVLQFFPPGGAVFEKGLVPSITPNPEDG